LFEGLKRAFQSLSERLSKATPSKDEIRDALEDFKLMLLESDVSMEAAEWVADLLRARIAELRVPRFGDLYDHLRPIYRDILSEALLEASPQEFLGDISRKVLGDGGPYVILFVGPNGGGKTTTVAKIAYWLKSSGFSPVVACSDTFRAAAIEQMRSLATLVGVRTVSQRYGADPAAVAMDTITSARARGEDVVLIDTAGRSEVKRNLLEEMRKIKRVTSPDSTILVLDSMTGSAAKEQARAFHKEVGVDYIVITKMDSDSRGGLSLTVCREIGRPILFMGVGQGVKDLRPFEKQFIIDRILT